MKKSRLLFLAVTVISVSGSPDPEAQFAPGLDSSSGMMQPPAGGQSRPPSQCGLQVDECCGMANEGCCMAGQECFTYYETVCENVQTQRCKPKFKQICVEEELPDCTIEKKRGSVNIFEEECKLTNKRECWNWERQVCDLRPSSIVAEVSWQNEKLVPIFNGTETKQKCETVTKCRYEDEEHVETEDVPVQKCDDVNEMKDQCRNVRVPVSRVVEQVQYEVRYVQECSVVTQPRCETSPCQSNGCTNGGSVCSTNEFQPQTVCPEAPGGSDTGANNCQQVEMPVCYGNLGSCSSYDQQCCYNNPTQVCRQVPQRFPVRRNVTIQDVKWEQQCDQVEVTRKDCRTEIETREKTVKTQKCHQYEDEVCVNYNVPSYEVKLEEKAENVSFVSRKCEFRTVTEQYCQTFPNAKYECRNNKPGTRQYILNKVVCKQQKRVQFCQNIPEGGCENVPEQKCKVVPRQVCQQGCSSSRMCNQCDQLRNQGIFSTCSTGTCPNYFPEDPVISGNWQTGGGFNPGNLGDSGFNPGDMGNSGFNPGDMGNSGFNPGDMGNSGFNPGGMGNSGFNPGNLGNSGFNPGNLGNNGFNPGNTGGSGFNPGYGDGSWGYNPGSGNTGLIPDVGTDLGNAGANEWSPGDNWYSPEDRAQPLYQNFYRDGYKPLDQFSNLIPNGNSGFNPGQYAPLQPGDSGFNPGTNGGWDQGGFFNPGNSAGVAEQAQPNKNDAFEEDLDEIEDESVVL